MLKLSASRELTLSLDGFDETNVAVPTDSPNWSVSPTDATLFTLAPQPDGDCLVVPTGKLGTGKVLVNLINDDSTVTYGEFEIEVVKPSKVARLVVKQKGGTRKVKHPVPPVPTPVPVTPPAPK